MKFHLRSAVTALFIVASGVSSVANAALVDRGGGLIYDLDRNITWLANANVNGSRTWDDAMTWASNLSYFDSVRNQTLTGWRLPNADPGCNNYNCFASEMGHLFYDELGGTASSSVLGSGDPDLALFTNLQSSYYWSGTADPQNPSLIMVFGFNNGLQGPSSKTILRYAWAVRPGDIAAVPVPAAAWLFGSGLLGLIGVARRKAA